MSRVAEDPPKHVLSFRVNDSELKLLRKMSQKNGADSSSFLCQCLLEVLRQGRA